MAHDLFLSLLHTHRGGDTVADADEDFSKWVEMDDYEPPEDAASHQSDASNQNDASHHGDDFADDDLLESEEVGLQEYMGTDDSSDDEYVGIVEPDGSGDDDEETEVSGGGKGQEATFVELLNQEVTRLIKLISSS